MPLFGTKFIRQVIKDCCTVKNGEDYEFTGIAAVVGTIFNCVVAIYALHVAQEVTLPTVGQLIKDFCFGEAALVAACAGGKGIKQNAEPE